jgi:hypothetical protein
MKTTKSFRFTEQDLKLLEEVHEYYKENYEARVSVSNMDNLHNWTLAQTIAVCVRDLHQQLVKGGKIKVE